MRLYKYLKWKIKDIYWDYKIKQDLRNLETNINLNPMMEDYFHENCGKKLIVDDTKDNEYYCKECDMFVTVF